MKVTASKNKVPIYFLIGIAILAVILFPLANLNFIIFLLMLVFFFAGIATFYNLILGYGGIFFISPMIFFAIGAYTDGWLTIKGGVAPVIGILIGGAFAAIGSLFFSLLAGKLRGLYMALYSVIFGLLLQSIVVQSDKPFILYWTNGAIGLQGLPDIEAFGIAFGDFGGLPYYYTAFGIFMISTLLVNGILNSKIGLALRSLRDGETYAWTLGVNPMLVKIVVFAVSAFFIGVIGGAQSHFFGLVTPFLFDVSWILVVFTLIAVGGVGTFLGPIVGALIIIPVNEYFRVFGAARLIVIGAIVIVTIMFASGGIMGRLTEYRASRQLKSSGEVPKILVRKAREN